MFVNAIEMHANIRVDGPNWLVDHPDLCSLRYVVTLLTISFSMMNFLFWAKNRANEKSESDSLKGASQDEDMSDTLGNASILYLRQAHQRKGIS